ncbi:hypothetical protein H6F52_06785 [Coleofasciculus sp. FACHB-542]|nr:hypothetical protein [Coleofasciculus sp. FACHB-542]
MRNCIQAHQDYRLTFIVKRSHPSSSTTTTRSHFPHIARKVRSLLDED